MRRILLIGVLGFLLAACNQNATSGSKPAPSPKNAKVTVSVTFPESLSEAPYSGLSSIWKLFSNNPKDIQPTGAPINSQKAVITVYEGSTPVDSATVDRYNPTATLLLPAGKSYRFEASVKDYNGVEVAWGEATQAISGDTSVTLSVQTILRSALLIPVGGLTANNSEVDVFLYPLTGITGATVPATDYEVTYTVQGGTILDQNKRGVRIAWDGTSDPVTVTAQVSGFGEDHNPITIERVYSITPATGQGAPLSITGLLPNWPSPFQAKVTAFDVFGAPLYETPVGTDGSFSLQLPGGDALTPIAIDLSELFAVLPEAGCTVFWTTEPAPLLNATLVPGQFWITDQFTDSHLGTAFLSVSGYTLDAAFLYVDRSVQAEGNATCIAPDDRVITVTVNLNLAAGWNLVVSTGDPYSYLTVTGTPLNGSFQAPYTTPYHVVDWTLHWHTTITNLSISATPQSWAPSEGGSFYSTFTVSNNGPTSLSSVKVALDIPSGVINLDVEVPNGWFDSYSNTVYLYDSLAPGDSTSFTVNGTTASGTAGQTLTLSATIQTDYLTDINPNDNTATVTITPQGGSSANVSVGMDLDPPAVWFLSPSPGEVIPQGSTYTVQIEVWDSSSGESSTPDVTEIELYDGAQRLGALSSGEIAFNPTTNAYEFVWDLTTASPKPHLLTVFAYDTEGNVGQAEIPVQVQ